MKTGKVVFQKRFFTIVIGPKLIYSMISQKSSGWIQPTLGEHVGYVTRRNPLYFGEDPDMRF